MWARVDRRLRNHPEDDSQLRRFYLDKLLDVFHLKARLALQDGGDIRHAQERVEEYRTLVEEHGKKQDGYGKILETELEEVMNQLKEVSISS